MYTNREWEIHDIKSAFEDKVVKLNQEYYKKFKYAEGPYVELKVGENEITFREMFIPRFGETHIARVISPEGVKWMYAHKLTAEEKKNAPSGADWVVDNVYATCVKEGYCNG